MPNTARAARQDPRAERRRAGACHASSRCARDARASSARRRRGFTLIELAITLMVLAIAAALVAPSVGRGLDSLRTRAEVSGFVGFLRAAREQAVTRGRAQEVWLDPDTLTLVITADGSSVSASRSFSYLLRIDADPPDARSVRFQPQGLSSGGRFYLLAPGERRYLVTVDPLTGRVAGRLAES